MWISTNCSTASDTQTMVLQHLLGWANSSDRLVVGTLVLILWFHRVNFSEIAHIFVERRFNTAGLPLLSILSMSVKFRTLYPIPSNAVRYNRVCVIIEIVITKFYCSVFVLDPTSCSLFYLWTDFLSVFIISPSVPLQSALLPDLSFFSTYEVRVRAGNFRNGSSLWGDYTNALYVTTDIAGRFLAPVRPPQIQTTAAFWKGLTDSRNKNELN